MSWRSITPAAISFVFAVGAERVNGQTSSDPLKQSIEKSVTKSLSDFFDAVRPKPAAPSPPPVLTAAEIDELARLITAVLSPGHKLNPPAATLPDASSKKPVQPQPLPQAGGEVPRDANLPSGMERVGPVRFGVPEGWAVTTRRSDAVIMKKGGAYIILSRHQGFARAPYTPEGIGQAIIKNSWMRATTSQTKIGKEGLPAFRMRRDSMEAVLFSHGGGVYMISTDSTGDAFDKVLQSIDTRNLPPGNQPNPPAPAQNPMARQGLQNVTEQLSGFFDGPVTGPGPGIENDMRALEAVLRGETVPQQCTWGVGEIITRLQLPYPRLPSTGHGMRWFNGIFPQGQQPRQGAIMVLNAWQGNSYGHVGVVRDVTTVAGRTRFTVEHWNWDGRGTRMTTEFELLGRQYAGPRNTSALGNVMENQAIRVVGGTREYPLRGFVFPPE